MDRLESMSVLLAVVEAGSLSAAARKLGTPLATVSRKVSELEGHLGTQLLIRSSRRVALTDAAQAYVAVCRRVLEDVAEAEQAVAGEFSAPKGHLVITAPIVFGRLHVLPMVIAFLAAYADISVRLVLADGIANLVDEQIDLAVRIGALPVSSLVASRVGEIRRVACASPRYLGTRGTPTAPTQLLDHDCVTFEGLSSAEAWVFARAGGDIVVPVRSRLAVTTAEAAIDAAEAGLGITRVLSYQVTSALRAGRLTLLLQGFEPAPSPVSLVHAGHRPLPLKLRAFLDFAAPRLKALLARDG